MGSEDHYLKIWEEAADNLDLEYNSMEYERLEQMFWEDPQEFAYHYGKVLSKEQREELGYYDVIHGLPKGMEPTRQEILDNWPKSAIQPILWSKELLEEISSHRKALLIGCSEYENYFFHHLTCPVNDVKAFKSILENKETGQFGNVITMKEKVIDVEAKEKIKTFISSSSSGDTILLYFSGHGFASSKGDKIYLALSNTDINEPETAIDGDFLIEAYNQSLCSSLLLILDCCNSGAISSQLGKHFKEKPNLPKNKYNEVFGYGGFRVITASTRSENSFEDPNNGLSIFTSCFLEGIEFGKADVDDNGVVTDFEAFNYATRKLSALELYDTYTQTPTINLIDARSPFLLALNKNVVEFPSVEETSVEHLNKYLAVKSMIELVNTCQPIIFHVGCNRYYFAPIEGAMAIANSLNVSSTHTPFIRQTNFGFQCETYFFENLIPEKARLTKPVNYLVKTLLNVNYEDITMIDGVDLRNNYLWKLFIPEGTIFI